MKRLIFLLLPLLAACAHRRCPEAGPVGAQKPQPANPIATSYSSVHPATQFETIDIDLNDASRNRKVPIRAFLPAGNAPAPVIIFSPGLGSSRAGYEYLGQAWAKAGYVVLHVQHVDSDSDLSLYRLYRASYAPQVWRDRPKDISFVIETLQRHEPVLQRVWQRADLEHIGVAGHSLGAQTALNVAGVPFTFRGETTRTEMKNADVDAVVALSVPFMPAAPDPSYFANVTAPVLHMTGTKDESPAFDTMLCHKRVPFDWISGPSQYLVTMEGAVHRSFAGEKEAGGENIELYHATIIEFSTAFWDATLRDDAKARDWLDRVTPKGATVERK